MLIMCIILDHIKVPVIVSDRQQYSCTQFMFSGVFSPPLFLPSFLPSFQSFSFLPFRSFLLFSFFLSLIIPPPSFFPLTTTPYTPLSWLFSQGVLRRLWEQRGFLWHLWGDLRSSAACVGRALWIYGPFPSLKSESYSLYHVAINTNMFQAGFFIACLLLLL